MFIWWCIFFKIPVAPLSRSRLFYKIDRPMQKKQPACAFSNEEEVCSCQNYYISKGRRGAPIFQLWALFNLSSCLLPWINGSKLAISPGLKVWIELSIREPGGGPHQPSVLPGEEFSSRHCCTAKKCLDEHAIWLVTSSSECHDPRGSKCDVDTMGLNVSYYKIMAVPRRGSHTNYAIY